MANDNENDLRMKLDFYLKEKIMVHVELNNKKFLNARIIEKKSENIYIINERVFGIMHLFISDIYSLSEFVEGRK